MILFDFTRTPDPEPSDVSLKVGKCVHTVQPTFSTQQQGVNESIHQQRGKNMASQPLRGQATLIRSVRGRKEGQSSIRGRTEAAQSLRGKPGAITPSRGRIAKIPQPRRQALGSLQNHGQDVGSRQQGGRAVTHQQPVRSTLGSSLLNERDSGPSSLHSRIKSVPKEQMQHVPNPSLRNPDAGTSGTFHEGSFIVKSIDCNIFKDFIF